MATWGWVQTLQSTISWQFIFRVLAKALVLFVLLNLVFAVLNPIPFLGSLSIYNRIVPGRDRLPFGEDDRAYNLSLDDINAMFMSHTTQQAKTADEYRVLLIGDSSVWGILLRPEETLSGQINQQQAIVADGRILTAYNLGHPVMSLTKDLMLLERGLQHKPDMVVWLTTLESFPIEEQLAAPLVQNNRSTITSLIQEHELPLPIEDLPPEPSFVDRTFVGQRRPIADWVRLQAFGVMWGITGIDQIYPNDFPLRRNDFEEDLSWHTFPEPGSLEDNLAISVLHAGHEMVGDIPFLIVNEPIFIADGENSDLRYNFWYPQWAYDDYREILKKTAEQSGWNYIDAWDLVAPNEFTDSPVHLTPEGSQQLAEYLMPRILELINERKP